MSRVRTVRPASVFEPLELLGIVRVVAESSEVEVPRHISTRVWDRARDLDGQFTYAPAARRICEHLRLPWRKVRGLAFMSGHSQRVALGHALGGDEADWLTEEYSAFVLKLVAHRLHRSTLTPNQYRAERQAMLDSNVKQSYVAQIPLPTAEQIEVVARNWDAALSRAGLRRRQGLGGQRAHTSPVPIVEVLERCYEHHKTEPTLGELESFARANGIPFPRKERGRPYSTYIRTWRQTRVARGLAIPDGPPPKPERPDYSRDVGAALPGERRAKGSWCDGDEVVDWVARYLGSLKPRDQSSQRAYDAWARHQDGAPWASVVQRHGGWVAVRDGAWTRLRQ